MILSFIVLPDPRYKLQLLKILHVVLYSEGELERRIQVGQVPNRLGHLENLICFRLNFDANLAALRNGKFDVDSYLNLPLVPRTEDVEFDVLEYWKSQSVSFPSKSSFSMEIDF
ncbi:hypothetical protein GQ457_02G029190 [Hibiscus cannabinus]